jgi:molybdopterin-synthase adenylyltransferase
LNRQLLFDPGDIGEKKVLVAEQKLKSFNPEAKIEAFDANINSKNGEKLTEDFDLVIDALDNFEARYVLNSICQKKGIPLVHGAVRDFEGRVTTILPGKTPCLRCIYPLAPARGVTPVVGVAPAVIGSLQSTEAIKFFLGLGDLLAGRLLIYDGLSMEFEQIKLEKVPGCFDCRTVGAG